jgi:adenylate kinase family enzyme
MTVIGLSALLVSPTTAHQREGLITIGVPRAVTQVKAIDSFAIGNRLHQAVECGFFTILIHSLSSSGAADSSSYASAGWMDG